MRGNGNMEGQRQKSGGGRRRRRKAKGKGKKQNSAPTEPVTIAARRPNSPLLSRPTGRRAIAASASPTQAKGPPSDAPEAEPKQSTAARPQRRAARIVELPRGSADSREQERLRLLDRLMASETRGAITRSADAFREAGFELPEEQEVQLQLLEHFDEDVAREAVAVLTRLFEHEPPLKRPVLDQRLKRLEEYADEPSTGEMAAALRRKIR